VATATPLLIVLFPQKDVREAQVDLIEYPEPMAVRNTSLCVAWRRCRKEPQSPVAWEEFLACARAKLWRVAARTAERCGMRNPAEIDDIFQEICIKISSISPALPEYVLNDDSSAEAYLTVVAANAGRDLLRAHFAGKRGARVTDNIDGHLHTLFGATDEALRRDVLLSQLEEHLEGDHRDQTVFWLYYRQGFTAKEIAQVPTFGLTQKGVESLLGRMTSSLREKVGRGAGSRSRVEKETDRT
jgi:RNA polymerase sigma-70 factor, ECF subfamily